MSDGTAGEAALEVSRETPATPPVAAALFPAHRLALAERFAGILGGAGVTRGLIGPREAPRLWERHLLNCAVLAQVLPERASVADIGSGAGLPGVVLAIARPDVSITLIEPLLRRTTYLEQVVAELCLDRVEVVRARAEALHGARTFDVVTSRAVAPMSRLLGWSMPLVAPHGALVAMKGSSVTAELEDAADILSDLGCAPPRVASLGAELLTEPTVTVTVSWADFSRVSWPSARTSRPSPSSRGRPRRRGRSS